MNDRLQWFPFYVADFLLDHRVQRMTTEQVGVYILLLARSWWEGSIPADPSEIEELITTVVQRPFNEVWDDRLTPCWVPMKADPTRLVNPRLEAERERQSEMQRQRSNAGKASADKRLQRQRPFNDRSTDNVRSVQLTEQSRTEKKTETAASAATKPIAKPKSDLLSNWVAQLHEEHGRFLGSASVSMTGGILKPQFETFGLPRLRAALNMFRQWGPKDAWHAKNLTLGHFAKTIAVWDAKNDLDDPDEWAALQADPVKLTAHYETRATA